MNPSLAYFCSLDYIFSVVYVYIYFLYRPTQNMSPYTCLNFNYFSCIGET